MGWDDLRAAAAASTQAIYGETVSYTPLGSTAVEIQAVFEEAAAEIEMMGGVGVQATRPVLTVLLSDLPQPPVKGDAVTVAGTNYLVAEPKPEDGPHRRLVLELDPS